MPGPGGLLSREQFESTQRGGLLDVLATRIPNKGRDLHWTEVELLAVHVWKVYMDVWWTRILLFEVQKVPQDECRSEQVLAWRDQALLVFAVLVFFDMAVRARPAAAQCGVWGRARTTTRSSG